MRNIGERRGGERGSAFVISILVLFVLTVLGMALTLNSSTEKDIAANYRWGEAAFFNADAGLEYAKNVLAGYAVRDGDFRNALPPARGATEMNSRPNDPAACTDPTQPGCRDYQFSVQQGAVTLFIGRVLRDLNGRTLQYDFRNPVSGDLRGDIDGDGSSDVSGTVTIWVRRPLAGSEDYGFTGNLHDRVVITAEGTAPNYEEAAGGRPSSMRRIEVSLRLPPPGVSGDKYSDATKGSDSESKAAQVGSRLTSVQ